MEVLMQLFNLENKVIVVGGGAGQIGFSMAIALADTGAQVVIADLDAAMANEKRNALSDTLKSRMTVIQVDVSKRAEVLQLFKDVHNTQGSLYGLINCFHFKGNSRKLDTGASFFSDFENYPEEAWDMVHDVNLKGTFLMSQAAIPYFKQNGEGVVVNISSTYGNVSANKSIYGDSGINSPVAYATSKAAIINFTRYLATHYADCGIRANVLSPGGVYNNQSEEFITNYTRLTPLNRMAEANDYQGAILYLMSQASSYMTGANLIVDGGWTAW